jgi:hypothetical protein
VLVGLHLGFSAAAQALFAWQFAQNPRVIATHLLVVAEWDVALLAALRVVEVARPRAVAWPGTVFRLLLAVTCTIQVYLYALNVISNLSWGRNITAHLVAAFAPTVWSGREPFPVGAGAITVFALGTLAVALGLALWGPMPGTGRLPGEPGRFQRRGRRIEWVGAVGMAAAAIVVLAVTVQRGIAERDSLFWKHELVSSFFRPEGFAFEPSARRHAVAARDASLRAAYPRAVPGAHRKHVVLIIVDSLRADRMHVYGYQRATTPFLSRLVRDGRMKRVEAAFSTCSESFCGITSTLASRRFLDISARTFQLQDVLHDQGYQSWFVLSGNHGAWNGLPSFYHVSDDRFFDGSQTRRFTMDDDRLVLEGLEAVPAAAPGQPAFLLPAPDVHALSRRAVSRLTRLYAVRRRAERGPRALQDPGSAEQAGSVRRQGPPGRRRHPADLRDAAHPRVSGRRRRGRHRRPRRGARRAPLGARLAPLRRGHPDSDADLRRPAAILPGSDLRHPGGHRAHHSRSPGPADSRVVGRGIAARRDATALHVPSDLLRDPTASRCSIATGGR